MLVKMYIIWNSLFSGVDGGCWEVKSITGICEYSTYAATKGRKQNNRVLGTPRRERASTLKIPEKKKIPKVGPGQGEELK